MGIRAVKQSLARRSRNIREIFASICLVQPASARRKLALSIVTVLDKRSIDAIAQDFQIEHFD